NAEEFGDIVVRANPDGSFVRLKDVARIELGGENYNMQAYTNGAPAALFALYQVPGSNALEVANRVKSAMARLAERFPSDMRTDLTIDTLSLLGLVLAVGLVVDDAIVVVEAVQAKIDEGLTPHDAAIAAMDEVGGALVGIALVLSSVFIPAGFILGITGSLYRQFALT